MRGKGGLLVVLSVFCACGYRTMHQRSGEASHSGLRLAVAIVGSRLTFNNVFFCIVVDATTAAMRRSFAKSQSCALFIVWFEMEQIGSVNGHVGVFVGEVGSKRALLQ